MIIKHLLACLAVCSIAFLPLKTAASENSNAHILESFTVTTQNVQVREFTQSSIQFRSDSNAYFIKLEPNAAGKVVFSLTGIGYASTVKFSNLLFGVKITGYCADKVIHPVFSFDDVNRDIIVDQNMLIFQRIYGSIPVWFNEQVDSINLQFSNSYGAHVSQYLGIQDLKIVPRMEVSSNPLVAPCLQNRVMIAIDGSSSIDKDERGMIGSQLLEFIRKSGFARDSNTLCIAEFGSELVATVESAERKELIDAVQKYKRDRNHKSKFTTWTNWSVALDEAIIRQPQVFIMITDGWSNWDGKASSFSAQYERLIAQCNQLKTNGTRLLFITSDIDGQKNSKSILSSFLNHAETCELRDGMLTRDMDLSNVDLITLNSFAAMEHINFSSILECPIPPLEEILAGGNSFDIIW